MISHFLAISNKKGSEKGPDPFSYAQMKFQRAFSNNFSLISYPLQRLNAPKYGIVKGSDPFTFKNKYKKITIDLL